VKHTDVCSWIDPPSWLIRQVNKESKKDRTIGHNKAAAQSQKETAEASPDRTDSELSTSFKWA